MILSTFKKENQGFMRSGRIRIALLTVLLLIAVAFWISSKHYEATNRMYDSAKTSERANWDGQGEKNPHSAAHYGTYAFKPKYPLSLIDQGVDKYVGSSIFLEAHARHEAQFSEAADQTGLARFGNLSPDFILLFIMPLLIILLGYNSFTKEHEMGTITLLRSEGASFYKLALGKWLSLFFPILVITSLLFLGAGLVLSQLPDYGVFQWSALGDLYGVYLVYYIIFTNLVLFISAKSKRSGVSLVLSLSLWILSCLALPKAASNVAGHLHPYPTRQEFAAEVLKDKENGLDGHNPWNKKAQTLQAEVLAEYGVDSLHQLPFNFDAYRMQKSEEHEAEIYYKHYDKLKEQYRKQAEVYDGLAMVSPYLATRFLSMSLAHTDYATHWGFADAAEQYRVATQAFLNGNFAENSKYGEWGYRADADFWKELPPFEYDPPELSTIVSQNQRKLWVMALWCIGSFALLLFTTKKL
ncbi:ABC transporter permease [Sediminicola luteus]|uniref:ABC transporter permease n=1 Tax=Sediminicola luteus TaxID=319238 RepID=A0A2A4GF90_9FLAO|nr:DUF3526 domain-containing protein [Sediminicola luteus]PCE66640.1 hypothetical protein B7P33_04925 [Sediminicola luteus]